MKGIDVNLHDLLRSGYTFTPEEYELETRYVMVNSALLLISLIILPISVLYYFADGTQNALVHFTAVPLALLSMYLARKVGKDNYTRLVYVMSLFFSSIIFYAYYESPNSYPAAAWIIIQIIALFLILDVYIGIMIALMFTIYILIMNSLVLEYHSLQYVLLQVTPVILGVLLVFIFEKKFRRTIQLLKESNVLLDKRVQERTKALEEEKKTLDYQAHYNYLTDLPNRMKFYQEIQKWIFSAEREKSKFGLFFIDLDRFKKVNDSYGHDTGDKVIQITALRIAKIVGKKNFFAHISGDEFTLLISFEGDIKELNKMAEQVISVIEEPIYTTEATIYISASIGISCYPEDSVYYADLIKYADTTMFEAKKSGRGTYRFYAEEMSDKLEERVQMEMEMHQAIHNDAFVLYYQPQIDMRTADIIGIEVLIRWDHEKLGIVKADKFIPLAEDTGVIIALDHYIIKKGMEQVVRWKKSGLELPRVSFNFSTKHLQQKDFVDVIAALLKETGCKGEWIELEITESHIASSIDMAVIVLGALKSLGIGIAIDDFGTGYSSLTYLKHLPADKLKIDKSFIENLRQDSVDMTITQAIINIGNSLSFMVIAEGVETEAQRIYLISHQCYHTQGHLYYEAMPADDMEKLLA
jgi:diguanylate cyclase (GGDEF)-like protein